jgi:hypothetical protein
MICEPAKYHRTPKSNISVFIAAHLNECIKDILLSHSSGKITCNRSAEIPYR